MTGGGYSPSALPVQETGGIIRRGYRGGKGVKSVFVCLHVCELGDRPATLSRVYPASCPMCAGGDVLESPETMKGMER